MKERLIKLAPKVGLPLFFVVCVILFSTWTFPYETLKERIVTTFNAQQRATNGQEELEIDHLTSSWVTGVKASGVKIATASSEAGKAPSILALDEVRARISILPLLIGHKNISYRIDAFGGEVEGEYDEHGQGRALEADLDQVDLSQIGPLTEATGLPFVGKLKGTIRLDMPDGKLSKAAGSVALEGSDVAAGDGKAKIKGLLALPKITIGPLSLTAEAKDGVLKITKLNAAGHDVELQADGRIQLRDPATDSTCDVNLKFKINDAYRSKDDKTQTLFGTPGTNKPALFEFDPKVKQAKRPDGFFAFHMRGQLGRPEFDPAGSAPTTARPQ